MVADAEAIAADVAEKNVQCCKMQNDAYTESIGNTGDTFRVNQLAPDQEQCLPLAGTPHPTPSASRIHFHLPGASSQ